MSLITPDLDVFVRDFSAGFLDTPESDTLPTGATPDAANAVFTHGTTSGDAKRATMQKRPGSRMLNATVIAASKAVTGLVEFAPLTAAVQFLAACDVNVWKYDESTATFTGLFGGGGGPGIVSGSLVRFLCVRGQLYICDGTSVIRYNGTTSYAAGLTTPGAAPTLAATTGPGVTGTFEGYAVWYDTNTDHESSPSAVCTPVELTNEQRLWTIPAGTPPSAATHWRVYCRRTDTGETDYYRAATTAIGTSTVTEAVLDAARRTPGPRPNVNDPPPGFAFMGSWKGFGIGVKTDGDYFYVSKAGDLQSWHPSDVLPVLVGGRSITAGHNVGEEFLLQSPNKSWRLTGDAMPLVPKEVSESFGCVTQEAGLEAADAFWGWDERKGPYVASKDLATWTSLTDGRIETILATVNRTAFASIRAGHDSVHHLIVWAVPTGTSTRCRTLLAYDYLVGAWLPPITGLEYASLGAWTKTDGAHGFYAGDQWGRVYELFSGTREGVPTGTWAVVADVTGATADTVTAAAGVFYWTESGLVGLPVALVSPAGEWQWRRILSNTGYTITLDTTNDTAWGTVPASPFTGWTVVVGGINWYWKTPWYDFGAPDKKKRGGFFTLQGKAAAAAHEIDVQLYLDDNEGAVSDKAFTFPITGGAGVWGEGIWGEGIWGTSLWGTIARRMRKQRIHRSFFTCQFQFANAYPDQEIAITGYRIEADWLARKRVGGV